MRKLMLVLVAMAVTGMVGCYQQNYYRPSYSAPVAAKPSKPEPAPIPQKLPPLAKDWQKRVMAQTKNDFKDPDAVKYRFLTKPTSCSVIYYGKVSNSASAAINGYCGKVAINGKNSYGAYTGEKLYFYIIHNNNNSEVSEYDNEYLEFIFNPPIETWK